MNAPPNFDPVTAHSDSDVVHWLTNETRDERFIDNIFAKLCVRLQRAGIPVRVSLWQIEPFGEIDLRKGLHLSSYRRLLNFETVAFYGLDVDVASSTANASTRLPPR